MSQQRGNRTLTGNLSLNGNQSIIREQPRLPARNGPPPNRARQPVGCCQRGAIVFMDKAHKADYRCPKHQAQK